MSLWEKIALRYVDLTRFVKSLIYSIIRFNGILNFAVVNIMKCKIIHSNIRNMEHEFVFQLQTL